MHLMVGLFRKFFWLVLFLISTLAFTTLFEHGTSNFAQNARLEVENFKKLIESRIARPKDESDKVAH
jgi:ferritin-like protein